MDSGLAAYAAPRNDGERLAGSQAKKAAIVQALTGRSFTKVICPTGGAREFVSTPLRKNKSLRDLLKSDL